VGRNSIGFIGLGGMGEPMAANLLSAGFALRVYNRTTAKAVPLVEQGAELAESPADACEPGGVVISMVADDRALQDVVRGPSGLVAGLGRGGLHISMSTIGVETARQLADEHARAGQHYVGAPVFGRPDAARAKQLAVCLAGPPEARQRALPILRDLGRGVWELGDEAHAANVVKLSGNFLIAAAMEAMGEAFTLAEKHGVDRAAVASLMAETLFACPVYEGYGKAIAARSHEPAGFRLDLGLKDVTLVQEAAKASLTPMPLAGLLRERLLSALAHGDCEKDWSALALGARRDAGLD
jgi:3-hydroxyisobutyrate dehydrogenase-like beta-hydroxyacid dehydrogenase